jgi:HlyD family secretion protein
MMGRYRNYVVGAAVLITGAVAIALIATSGKRSADAAARPEVQPRWVLACSGRIEGSSETTEIGAGIDGVVDKLLVSEGRTVQAGTPLLRLSCADLEATRRQVSADLESAREQRMRIYRGARDEERKAATQRRIVAEAVLKESELRFQRATKLYDGLVISREQFDQSARDVVVARAQLAEAKSQEALTQAGPLPEEKAKADADVRSAEGRVDALTTQLDKCTVRAPSDGTVLRFYARRGETFSTLYPKPLLKFADITATRVRAEVDERDIAHIFAGQHVAVSADAFPGTQFGGEVISIAPFMGAKTAISSDSADKADRDVQQVVIELGRDLGQKLPIGLRVTVRFVSGPTGTTDSSALGRRPD